MALSALQDYLERGRALLREEERALLASGPGLAARFVRYPLDLARARAVKQPDDLAARDPALVAWLAEGARILGRGYFRLRVFGAERVPASGPVLLVGNHNGGLMPFEAVFTLLAVVDQHGPERAVRPLAHDVLFHDDTVRGLVQRAGALRAGQEGAERALRDGDGVLVYPGSDLDAFRPFSQRHRVELGQRRGFLRLARRTGVSVLPVVSTGTHEQLIVLSRGDALSRRLDGRRFLRTGVLPLTLSVPWGLSLGFVPYLPLPAQTSVSFLEPISPEELFRDAGGDEDTMLERAYRLVERRMQAGLDELARGRRFLLGRPEDRRAAR